MTTETVWIIIGVLAWASFLLLIWALCRVSAEGDREQEQAHVDRMMRGWER